MKYKNSNNEWKTIKVKNYGIEQTPIGSMIYYPSQNIPAGYLVCDGREVLISDYQELFDVIGYIGGDNVLEGYFRIPDMQGIVPAGYNPWITRPDHALYGNFGDQVGASTHTLTVDEMPSHTHGFRAVKDIFNTDSNNNTGIAKATNEQGNNTGFTNYATDSIQATGGSQPHPIVQPTKLYHWLIKAKNIVTLGGYTEDFEVTGDLNVLGKININNNPVITFIERTIVSSGNVASVTTGSWQNMLTTPININVEAGKYLCVISFTVSGLTGNGMATIRPQIDGSESSAAHRCSLPIGNGLLSSGQITLYKAISTGTHTVNTQIFSNVEVKPGIIYVELYKIGNV